MTKFLMALFGTLALAGIGAAQAQGIGVDGARHLLNRTGFAASESEIQSFSRLTREQATDRIMKGALTVAITPPPRWIDEPIIPPYRMREMSREEREAERKLNIERALELREWWYREMLDTPSPLTEKMTLFWHNHFSTSQQKVRFTPLMYRQNVTLRQNALGNFGILLHEIARDPAMVIYLDNAQNRREQPNENFAREVMELFTLGEGNYTEREIKDVARAFTGWSLDRDTGQFFFRPRLHDFGQKVVLGRSGDFDGDAVLDILLANPQTAEFIARKLWKEFISPTPDDEDLHRFARIFRNSRYDIKTVMRAILDSDAFYAAENRATLVKSPVELVVGTLKQFEMEAPNLRPFVIAGALLGQNVFAPPNVKGWPGGEAWINSATLLGRKQLLDRLFRADDRAELTTARFDEGAEGLDGRAGREARMQRRMDRALGGIRFRPDQWARQFSSQDREKSVTRTVLAMAPQIAPTAKVGDVNELLKHLVADPAYQLK
jgi:uncharacterized protein (DUF1800 family)